MVDFLARLAERTLGVASMVQPIIAPMFAPEPRLANEALSFQRESNSEAQSMIAPRPARGVQPIHPDDMSLDAAHANMTPAGVKLSFPPALVPINDYLSTGQGIPGSIYAQAGSSHVENTPGFPLVAAPRNVPATNTSAISDHGGTTPDLNVPPGLPTGEVSPAPRTEFPEHGMVAKARQAMTGVPLAGTLETLLPVQYFEASAPEKSTPAQTIRVTIGRIEVRAVMSTHEPAVRPAFTRPKLKLSLDDYLKQQNGG